MKHLVILPLFALLLASCSNHGDKVSKDYLEVYYKDGATKEQAQKTLDYLYPRWQDNGDKTPKKSIQLTKTGDTVNFRMVANMDVMENIDDDVFYTTGNEISAVLGNVPVNVVLTNKSFETVRTYTYSKMELPDFGEKIVSGNIEVYAKDGFSIEQATQLAQFLDREVAPNTAISFQVSRESDGYYTVKMVSVKEAAEGMSETVANELAEKMSQGVFNGAPMIFELSDAQFRSFKTFKYNPDNTIIDTSAVR